jgi:hypothetical protein
VFIETENGTFSKSLLTGPILVLVVFLFFYPIYLFMFFFYLRQLYLDAFYLNVDMTRSALGSAIFHCRQAVPKGAYLPAFIDWISKPGNVLLLRMNTSKIKLNNI